MKKYFIHYTADFSNTYSLAYTDDGYEPEGWMRITRKTALTKAREESRRRRDDPSFAGYADTVIAPYGMDEDVAAYCYELAQYQRKGWYMDEGRILCHH